MIMIWCGEGGMVRFDCTSEFDMDLLNFVSLEDTKVEFYFALEGLACDEDVLGQTERDGVVRHGHWRVSDYERLAECGKRRPAWTKACAGPALGLGAICMLLACCVHQTKIRNKKHHS